MSASPIQIELKRSGDLSSLGDDWQALERRAEHSWFQSWDWIGCWLAELEPVVRPDVLVARDDDRIVGLALMTRHRQTRHSVITSRGFYLHETGDPQFDAITMEYNGFLVQRDRSEEIVRAFLGYLADAVTDCDEFYLGGVGTSYERLAADTELTVYCRSRSHCHFVDLAVLGAHERGSFPYLSANTRSQLRRAIRLYEKRGPLSVELPPDIDTALHFWGELIELHQSYWRKRGQPGAFSNPFFEALHRRLIISHFDDSKVQLLRFSAGGEPLGYLYNFVDQGHVYNYQSGFRYEPDNKLKVGLVTHAFAIQHFADNGYAIYDFMAGDSQYKRSFATGQSELVWLVLQRPLVRFRLEHLVRKARSRLSASCLATRSSCRPSTSYL